MKKNESILQSACIQWLRYQRPDWVFFAVPNGGSRHAREALRLKQEGVLAGVSDLILVAPVGVFFVEMKTPKGKQSPAQKDFQRKIEALGYTYALCHTFEDFTNFVNSIQ